MTVPYWVEDAVFYQIFPDRFANGDASNDPVNVQKWGSAPTIHGFQGGDLRGIIENFDYLLDLGINALYLNPIFESPSTHRYNATDYLKIDSKLGTLKEFKALLEVAHRNDVRVVLDGVFNHCARGFFAFSDLLENQENSPYRDWFHVQRFPVDAYSPGDAQDFLAWWKYKSLPKFNTTNPHVRKYLLNVARYWIEQGADGWRLDVPNEIDDDSFWAEFRHVVKTANPDAYILGEIWEALPQWVGETKFDGLMNYPLKEAVLGLLQGKLTTVQFTERVEKLMQIYPRANTYAMYLPLGSHDTERLATVLGGDLAKIRLAFMLQFTFPGAPAVYYGDEVGLEGTKDPDCRRAFPWDAARWKDDLRGYVQKLISLRKRHAVLRRGEMKRVSVEDGRGTCAFARTLGGETLLAVVNASATKHNVHLTVADLGWQDGRIVRNLLGEGEYIVNGDELNISLPAYSGLWVM